MEPIAILAGGLASRMAPLTDRMPKAMLPVAGRPFIAHQLALLAQQGFSDVVLCIGHLGEQVKDFVGDGSGWALRVRYSQDGETLLGTGGAVKRAVPLLGPSFFVMYGDSYLTCDFASVGRAFRASGKPALMTVYRNANRFGTSNVLFDRGRIVRYDKKSSDAGMQHIDYGLSVLTAKVLDGYPSDEAFDLAQVFEDLITAGNLAGFESADRFFEIGSTDGLRDTEAFLTHGGRRDSR